jgi:RNA-splicing ligase RtcB
VERRKCIPRQFVKPSYGNHYKNSVVLNFHYCSRGNLVHHYFCSDIHRIAAEEEAEAQAEAEAEAIAEADMASSTTNTRWASGLEEEEDVEREEDGDGDGNLY